MKSDGGRIRFMPNISRSIMPFSFAISPSLASSASFAQPGAADGSGEFKGTRLKWQSAGSTLALSMTGYPSTACSHALSENQLTLSGDDLQQALVPVNRGTSATGGLPGNTATLMPGGGSIAPEPAGGTANQGAEVSCGCPIPSSGASQAYRRHEDHRCLWRGHRAGFKERPPPKRGGRVTGRKSSRP